MRHLRMDFGIEFMFECFGGQLGKKVKLRAKLIIRAINTDDDDDNDHDDDDD